MEETTGFEGNGAQINSHSEDKEQYEFFTELEVSTRGLAIHTF